MDMGMFGSIYLFIIYLATERSRSEQPIDITSNCLNNEPARSCFVIIITNSCAILSTRAHTILVRVAVA